MTVEDIVSYPNNILAMMGNVHIHNIVVVLITLKVLWFNYILYIQILL